MTQHDMEMILDSDDGGVITLVPVKPLGGSWKDLINMQSEIVKLVPDKRCICCGGPADVSHN